MVTQAPASQQPVPHPPQKPPAAQSTTVPVNIVHHQEVEPCTSPASSVSHLPQANTTLLHGQESSIPQLPQVPAATDNSQLQGVLSPSPEATLEEDEHLEPVNLSMNASSSSQVLDFQLSTEEAVTEAEQLKTRDIDDILQKVIEEEREKAERVRKLVSSEA